ncbi:hypothetical protein EHQ53_18440 [Leptospira langatensis]|uniref:Uncharacterized protein n=1 Tax=Leptospira langatensis TaxID=2484983 RepID=A0A5F1ZPD9_9LEPT|nr:hypothetical protein [Leptospira langatensis]TGK05596.1 hypothetical protein EHO57_02680 [Leptospira langatensis]TGL38728.1 hypothetical protein EHQ53_18440 [Leptospira langatensis]
MEFFLYLIFLVITLVSLSLADYYFGLIHLSGKDTFEKTELTDWARIIPSKLVSIFEIGGSLQYGMIAFGISAFFSYVWTLMGGLIGSPHYTDSFGNYFFLSFIMPVLVLAFYSFLASEILKAARISPNSGSMLARLLAQEIPMLSGIFISVIASNLAVYGLYHEIAFLFVLPNILILSVLLILRWNGKVKFGGIRLDKDEEEDQDLEED